LFDFGPEICQHLPAAEQREWLVTNGNGGYASGTISGLLTRRYHGLLIAALKPPVGRTLLVTKFDETIDSAGGAFKLFADRLRDGSVEPNGFQYLERFHLEGTVPVWTFACADARLEKRIWMQPGANTTYVRYDLRRSCEPLTMSIRILVNHRDHHGNTHTPGWQTGVEPISGGLKVVAFEGATPFYLLSDGAQAIRGEKWSRNYFLSLEDYRGLDSLDDNLSPGIFQATLRPGGSLTLVASTESSPSLNGESAYAERREYERQLIARSVMEQEPEWVQHLVLASDQFVVSRPLPDGSWGRSIIAGYPWFSDWGRDTMISLPGLALVTGRHDVAEGVLRTFAHFVDQGMLPNRFPDQGEPPAYNTVDATLWYFEAIRAYHAATGDDQLLRDMIPVLMEIIRWHRRGTRYNIRVDPVDGLLHAGQPGVQLTWMDAKVGDWVVTPRIGKAVEINALWYNAVRITADFLSRLGEDSEPYVHLSDQIRDGFAHFWNQPAGYCYDLLGGPQGDDPALRPNQLLAVSLPHSPLSPVQQRSVVDVCAKKLVTPHGLRTLAPEEKGFIGRYGGDRRKRDAAYHQGTVWSWLIGPFVSAHLRVYDDTEAAKAFLNPLIQHLSDHGVGSISEIFDGDEPFTARGCFAQAWGVAELLRVWQTITEAERETKG
jgi:predicted glycogen debranching enzyme